MESRGRPEFQYEIVWLPIVDKSAPWTEAHQYRFEELSSAMPWYSLHHPKLLEPAVIRYIKEVWRFSNNTIMVVLDPQGKVVYPNALHMILIWGNSAYPFTTSKEEALWSKETWRLELLVDDIDRRIYEWKAQGKHICLYGGEDIDWIREFTSTVKHAAKAAGTELELVYVGKSNVTEMTKRVIGTILAGHLSHCWHELIYVWYFWARLEGLLYSKMQHGKNVEEDNIMSEVMTMLVNFNGNDQGWTTIWLGSTEMARAKGDVLLESFMRIHEWKKHIEHKGFVPALRQYLQQVLHNREHCKRLVLLVCVECGRAMEKHSMYTCTAD